MELSDLLPHAKQSKKRAFVSNELVSVWGRYYIYRRPRETKLRPKIPELIKVAPKKRNITRIENCRQVPVWGMTYQLKPGTKSMRPTWCTEAAWATAKKREQRGATITDPMLVEIMAMQARKAEEAEQARRAAMRARAA